MLCRVMLFSFALFLVARPALADVNQIGINTHIPAADVVQLADETGAHWIRVDNNWLHQTAPCSDNIGWFTPLDNSVTEAKARGLDVYMTLAYTPQCASLADSDGSPNNDVPNPTLYANYVRQAVAHYRGMGVTHFGLWNEANLDGFFEGSAAQYVSNIVVPGAPAVTAGCADAGFSDCKVLGPDLAHVGDYDVFLEDTLNAMNTAGVDFDIFAHHIYQSHTTSPLSGDSFINALEMRRFSFTRRSLMDVLTDTGNATAGVPSYEIWITETGYRAQPAIDPGEMTTQESYYMSTIDVQLARPWYTNTIFYEIVDSGDEIDGFGITRRNGGGFMLKDAYLALQNRIATDPGFDPTASPPDAGPGGTTADAGPPGPGEPDAGGGGPGAGNDAGIGEDPADEGGCAVSGGKPSGALLLLALLLVARCRRRLQISSQH
jgi:hypothetical protein